MSSSKNFLDLDINKLFEDHPIKEIEQIQKKILVEIDWKKVELRTLVGERYRDLIQAADTIAEMKKTSTDVTRRIGEIENKFRELQQKYSVGFKFESGKQSNREKSNISDSVVVQIKIMIDIPEQIWSSIDENNILRASQLFILGQHINYSLTFEIGQSVLTNKYPIVGKQWCVINNFRSVISEECNATLQSLDLTSEVAANCLSSLYLMEKISSRDLLQRLIQFRCKAVESIIRDESPHSVRHRIKLCVKLLTDTVSLIHSCFIKANNQETGLVPQYIKSISDQEASVMLFQLDLNTQLMEKYLPSVTKNHKPFSKNEFKNPEKSDLAEKINQWLHWVQKFVSTEIKRLLNLVTSVKGISNIRESSIALELPENWLNIRKDLSIPEINFWKDFFHQLLTDRVKEILRIRWTEALNALKSNLTEFLTKLTNEKFDYPENDLRWLIWKDSPSDIPQKLSKTGSVEVKRSLLMKARGYSSNLVLLCENLDKNLNLLLSDLEQYLYESEKVSSVDLLKMNLSIFDKFADRTEIQEDLQALSSMMIDEMIRFLKTDCLESPKFGRREINVIVIARFLQALTALSPSLNKCFTLSKASGLTITSVKWKNVCERLRKESENVWMLWVDCSGEKIRENFGKFLGSEAVGGLRIDAIVSEWERVVIEEEGEEGRRMNSEILVPFQPSVELHKFLAAVTKEMNRIVPHTVPKRVLREFSEAVVRELFEYYGGISGSGGLRQKGAFQVLLDVKYVTLLLVPRENKVLGEKSAEICNNILGKIDPFDSDVFYPFIQANVRKSVQRSLLIFGNLIPHLEQLHSVIGARELDTGKSISDPPGVLAVCTGAPWFPHLAVTVPSRNLPLVAVALPDKTQRKKTPVKEHSRNDSTGSTIKSGAAAFFGAMGSDWFGTS